MVKFLKQTFYSKPLVLYVLNLESVYLRILVHFDQSVSHCYLYLSVLILHACKSKHWYLLLAIEPLASFDVDTNVVLAVVGLVLSLVVRRDVLPTVVVSVFGSIVVLVVAVLDCPMPTKHLKLSKI